ncbi:TonB-dependent receptor [Sphingobium sp. BYY-5]|uniref:TonB-dependent receptor domain-containing protein n=1 Tax=Sphingobium sp. BYY-5 TaxID=2926400 RepID=UPI001FA734FB|nr:TonB-dependent receptor [Sphingobium sp. BYY-5]MCI4592147.1 TonB-dependent receptor [Sphingobium sp. BYY-5]
MVSAVQQLALQGGRQIVFRASLTGGKHTRSITGRMTFDMALRRLLKGSGLVSRETAGGVTIIEKALGPLNAETVPKAPPDPMSLLPLVVTAERRQEKVGLMSDIRVRPQEVSMAALVNASPSFFSQPAGSGQQALLVRGVGMAGEATTPVYFAGVPISGPSGTGSDAARTASDLALVDIRRVQISRIARNSEHGAGSLAGEIEIEPEEPVLGEWHGRSKVALGVQQGGDADVAASSTINVPVGSAAAFRATAYVSRDGGYIDNVRTGMRNVNDDDMAGFRLTARAVPVSNLDMSLMFAWQHRRVSDVSSWLQALGPYRTDRYFAAPTEHDFLLGRLKIDYDQGALKLTSISAAYRWRLDRRYDRTNATLLQGSDSEGCQRYYDLATPSCDAGQSQQYADHVASLAPSLLHIPILSTRVWQELRLGNEEADGIAWVAGLLVDHRSEKLRSQLSSFPLEEDAVPIIFGERRLAISKDQAGLFGNIAYRDEEGLLLSVGVRYDRYRVSSQNDVVVPNILSGSIASWPLTVKKSQGLGGRFHIDVPIVLGVTWHTQLVRSFRPGGVNTASVLLPDRLTYGSDSLWGAELGLNLRWGTVAEMTVTAYMNDWRNMQYRALSENRSHAYLVNIGNATIRGAEIELIVRPETSLTAKLEASLIHAQLSRVSDARLLVGSADIGDDIPFVPRHRLQFNLARDWRIGNGRGFRIEGDWQYQSGSWSTFSANDPDFTATSGFVLFGASFSYRWDRNDVALQARNIFDRVANLRTVTNGYGVGQTFSYGPRTILLSWNRRW